MNRFALRATAAAALAAASLSAFAQGPAHGHNQNRLDQVVVTATRTPQRLADVLADMTVLNRADIERQAFGGVADLLRAQGCFEMVRNGGPGTATSLFVRGAETRHTLVLVDGVRMDSQSTGGASWQSIPLAQIERIEIVRGAASAIYGTDAIGGVVQIFTRKGEGKPQVSLGVGAGNLGLRQADLSVSGATGVIDYALSAATERSDGYDSRPSGDAAFKGDRDGYKNRNYSARLGAQLASNHRLELLGLKSHLDSQYDGALKPTVDDHNINDAQALRGSWMAQWSPEFRTELSVGESRDRYETKPSVYLTDTRLRSAALSGSYKLGNGEFTGLLERKEDELINTSLTTSPAKGSAKREIGGAALGYVWGSGPVSFQLHGRHDRDSEFGNSNTGTVALGYQFAPGWRVQASTGTAFRAPTLFHRYTDYGNPNLKPEEGINAEIAVLFNKAGNELGLTVYRNKVDNLIVFGAAGPCASQFGCYENVGKARLQGAALKGATSLGPVRLSATLDLQAPKDVTPGTTNYGKLLARRAKTHGTLRADTSLAGWDLGAQVIASGERFDTAANTTRNGGYSVVSFDAQYNLSAGLRLQLKLDNAFDKPYQTARGYDSAPRQAFVGLRYTPQF